MNNKQVIKNLISNDSHAILETLEYVKSNGNAEILIHLIELLHKTDNTLIGDEIIKILENLKDQDCTSILAQSIDNPKFIEEQPILVAACWKNNLNFENYIDLFVSIFIASDFQLAFDALTVIDNFFSIDQAKAEICILKLENSIKNVPDDKKPLYYELIRIIENLIKNPAE